MLNPSLSILACVHVILWLQLERGGCYTACCFCRPDQRPTFKQLVEELAKLIWHNLFDMWWRNKWLCHTAAAIQLVILLIVCISDIIPESHLFYHRAMSCGPKSTIIRNSDFFLICRKGHTAWENVKKVSEQKSWEGNKCGVEMCWKWRCCINWRHGNMLMLAILVHTKSQMWKCLMWKASIVYGWYAYMHTCPYAVSNTFGDGDRVIAEP